MVRLLLTVLALVTPAIAGDGERVVVVDTTSSPHVRLRPVGLAESRWTGGFWAKRWELDQRVTLPTMKRVMEDPTNAATFHNLRVAAGAVTGEFQGNKWSDGDCYKWVEAAASVYAVTRDPALDREMDELIDLIARAQAADGYLSTQIQVTGKPRWTNIQDHELYNMGHLLTAACVHYRATGEESLLAVARKAADYLCGVFEPRPEALAAFGFNPSNIMGLVELYRTTGESRYLRLAGIFVTMRGSRPGGTDQNQSRVPLRKESEAVGHAVTGAYLWCGAADVAAETGETALLEALERLWDDVATRKTYITGGTGALRAGVAQRQFSLRWSADPVHEAFGAAYQLPNRLAYNETCGNIASAMWAWRMLVLTGEAKYADAMERVFYNSMLSGIGLGGNDYFYANTLLRGPAGVPLAKHDTARRWQATSKTAEVNCFCCPPNVARTIAQLATYAYSVSDETVWIHLYGGSRLQTRLPGGEVVSLEQETDYPWDGNVTVRVVEAPEREFSLRLRVPGWALSAALAVNGEVVEQKAAIGSYCELKRPWRSGDTVVLELPMPVAVMEGHPLVEETRGQVAVMRGPLVYCLESVDLPQGVKMDRVRLPRDVAWRVVPEPALLGGITTLCAEADLLEEGREAAGLYQRTGGGSAKRVPIRLIPYYAWCNRAEGEMAVWLPAD